jgi:hypothetical protein
MGEAKHASPVKLICAALAGRDEWLDRARELLEREFGPVDMESEIWPFEATDYYEKEMGPGLLRRVFSFKEMIDPENIVQAKHATNRMERRVGAKLSDSPERPVNLDVGYVSPGKLVLATTKDYSHRVYLRAGIYAEATLGWRHGAFEPWEWTYPDYRAEGYREFFANVRAACIAQLHEKGLI